MSIGFRPCPLPVLRRARGYEEDRRPARESGIGFLLFVKAENLIYFIEDKRHNGWDEAIFDDKRRTKVSSGEQSYSRVALLKLNRDGRFGRLSGAQVQKTVLDHLS